MDGSTTGRPVGRSRLKLWVVLLGALVVAGGGGYALATSFHPAPGVNCPAPEPASTGARSPIQHVFFFIKENHAFENYFGSLPGVTGYPPHGSFPTSYSGNGTISPYPLDANSTGDLPHDRASDLGSVDGGRMDHFVAQANADGYPNSAQAVGYYTASQIPDYYAYARNYTLGDHFFTGVLGPTLPNRLFDLGLTGMTWIYDAPPPAASISGPTLPNQFFNAGLPWDYFYSGSALGLTPLLVPQIATQSCVADRILPVQDLASTLAGPEAPALAYLDPSPDLNASEHPPANVTFGDQWTVAAVNTILSSPIANSTVIFLFYDEGGGFWDPVPPPSEPPLGDGVRVPLLVISPWSPPGLLYSNTTDPANLFHWAESNWGLPPLTARIADAPLPTGLFDFREPARAPLLLPTPVKFPGAISGAVRATGDPAPRGGRAIAPPTIADLAAPIARSDEAAGSTGPRAGPPRRGTHRACEWNGNFFSPGADRASHARPVRAPRRPRGRRAPGTGPGVRRPGGAPRLSRPGDPAGAAVPRRGGRRPPGRGGRGLPRLVDGPRAGDPRAPPLLLGARVPRRAPQPALDRVLPHREALVDRHRRGPARRVPPPRDRLQLLAARLGADHPPTVRAVVRT